MNHQKIFNSSFIDSLTPLQLLQSLIKQVTLATQPFNLWFHTETQ